MKGCSFKYVWSQNNWQHWGVINPGTSDSFITWAPGNEGTYQIYVDMIAPDGTRTTRTVSASVRSSWTPKVDIPMSASLDTPVKISPSATGADDKDLSYNYVWSYEDSWDSENWGSTVRSTGSFTKDAQWTFAPKKSGHYHLYVSIKDAAGVVKEVSSYITVTEHWPLDTVQTSIPKTATVGKPIDLKIGTKGANSHLTYKFVWESDDWKQWGVIQQPSATSTCQWTPTRYGDIDLYVDITNSVGETVTKVFKVQVSNNGISYSGVSFSNNDPAIGQTVTITPSVKVTNPYGVKYKFVWERDNWKDWGVIRDASPEATASWNLNVSGNINVFVDVIDANGKAITRQAALSVQSEKWTYTGVSSSASIVHAGTPVDFAAQTSGSTQYLSYKFVWQKNNWAQWGVIQPKTAGKNKVSWTPGEAGNYTIYVDAIDSSGRAVTKMVNLTAWNYSGVNITSSGANTWTVSANLGAWIPESAGFKYKFVWCAGNTWAPQDWGVLQGPSSSNSVSFHPSTMGVRSDYYYLYVDVIDPSGNVSTQSGRVLYAPNGKIGYQNPGGFYQVSSFNVQPRVSTGIFSYMTPSRISVDATREQCIEAFVARAWEYTYTYTPYVWNYACAPGVGVDCVGLVMQCVYATGMDLGEFNPYDHFATGPNGWHSHDANNLWNYGRVQHVSLSQRRRGDVISYPGHVAIYIGNDTVIEALGRNVHVANIWSYPGARGCLRFFQ